MSAYQAKISLIVEGEQKIKSLQDRISNLSRQITELKRLDIGGVFEDPVTSGAVSHLRKVRQKVHQDEAKATDGIIRGQRLLNNSTEQRLLQQIKLNAAVDLYGARVKALSRTGAGDQKQFQTRVEDIQKAFEFFKGKGSVRGVQATATELGRIVEYSREVTRLETGRINSQEKLKGYGAEIARYNKLGLDTSKAQATFDKYKVKAGTNQYVLADKYNSLLVKRLGLLKGESKESARIAQQQFGASSPVRGAANLTGSLINKQMGTQAAVALQAFKLKTTQAETKTEVGAVQDLQRQKTKALQDGTKTEVAAVQDLQRQKTKALQDGTKTEVAAVQDLQRQKTKALQDGTKAEVALAQQKQKTITTAGTKQEKLVNRADLLEQSLLQAKTKGLDVENAITRLQQVKNTLNRADLSTDINQLNVLERTLTNLQHQLKVEKAIAQTNKGSAKAPEDKKGAGGFFQQLSNPSSKLGSAVIGGGFPALMGGGPGAMIGGALGGAVGGFAGSIAASAIGQFIDQAVVSVKTLGNAFALVQDDYSAIRETGVQFTAELEKQVRAAKQLGDYTKAAQLQRTALIPTGDVAAYPGSKTSATENVAGSVNRLDAAFAKVTKTVSLLFGLIAAPFIDLIALFLKGLDSTLVTLNQIITGVGVLLDKIPGAADEIKRSNEQALKLTAEYQNQIAEQDKLIEQAIRLNKANAELNTLALKNVGLLGAEKQAADLELRSKEKQAALEEEILKIKEAARTGTSEQQAKAAQLEAQARIKSNGEVFKDQIALYNSLYDQIKQDNINIARQKEDQEKNYRDMVRDTAQIQNDLNLDIARKAQDLRVQNIEKENELIKRQADLRISGLELESKKRLSEMEKLTLGADPEEQQIKIGVAEAVDTLKIGLAKIEAESADRQRKLKTNLIRLDIENERYKYDMAVRINRLNVDNVNKIAVINAQINRQNQDASRQKYREGLELLRTQVDVAVASNKANIPGAKENVRLAKEQGINTAYYIESLNTLLTRAEDLEKLITRINTLLGKVPAALPSVQPLPTVSGDTSAVGRESDRLRGLTVSADRVSEQETKGKQAQVVYEQNKKLEAQAKTAAANMNAQMITTQQQLKLEQARATVLGSSINPELATQQVINNQIYEKAQRHLALLRESVVTNAKNIPNSKDYLEGLDKINIELEEGNRTLKANTIELEKQKSLNETALMLQAGKRQIAGVEAGARSGFIGQAQSAYATAITENRSVGEATALAQQAQALELATTKARALEGAYQDIGSATASLMTEGVAGLVAGTTTAQQVFADFLNNIGQALMKAAQQMIAQYLAIAAAQALANMFSPAAGASGASAGFGMPEIASGFGLGPQRMFADGGRPPVGVPSLVGEKGPELFVPSAAGTIIPAGPTAGIRNAMANGNGNGATAPILNMSFETTRFGNTDYVSREQLEAAMMQTRAEATKAGARRGMTMTLDKLQQSPSTRSRVGLG